VRTLLEPGALNLLLNELGRFRWDVIGIAETHWKGLDDSSTEDTGLSVLGEITTIDRVWHSSSVQKHRELYCRITQLTIE